MVGALARKTADVVVTTLTVNFERSQVIDYSTVIHAIDFGLLIKNPVKVRPNVWAYLVSFTFEVWIVIFLVALILVFNYFIQKKHFAHSKENEDLGIKNSFAVVGLAMLQMDYQITISKASLRTLHLSTWLFAYLVFAFYTADLTSRLTTLPNVASFSSLEGAIDMGFKLLLLEGAAQHLDFSSATDGAKHRIWINNIQPNPELLVQSSQEIRNKIIEGDKYAAFTHHNADPR